MLQLFVASLVVGIACGANSTYKSLDDILQAGVDTRVFPGAVGVVGNLDGLLYMNPVGKYSYSSKGTSMYMTTLFDLASVTKVVSTTSAVALLYQAGYLGLYTLVGDILGEAFNNGGKEGVTIVNCLVHNAGFAPDPVPYYNTVEFGCPQTSEPNPAEDFTCWNPLIYDSFMTEVLVTPPGEAYVYSDLSFITLQLVVGTVVLSNNLVSESDMSACMSIAAASRNQNLRTNQNTAADSQKIICAFEAFVRIEIFQRGANTVTDTTVTQPWMPSTSYLPPQNLWSYAAPTVNDTGPNSYVHKRYQGQVSDPNAYAMGGIAGHAGLFSNIADIAKFAQYMLSKSVDDAAVKESESLLLDAHLNTNTAALKASASMMPFLNSTTVKLFSTVYNITQSSRALGWTTNTPVVRCMALD